MAWVVKGLRMDALEQLLADEARASVRVVRETAERDARRARRAADRTAADAGAELEALDRLGRELRDSVRRARASSRPPSAPGPETLAPPVVVPAPAPVPRRRAGRASMRSSPLGELFRATAAG